MVQPTASPARLEGAARVEGEFVTGQHAKLLGSILDAGHASAHCAYFPNETDLQTCILSIRHLMEGMYMLKPKVDGSEYTQTKLRLALRSTRLLQDALMAGLDKGKD